MITLTSIAFVFCLQTTNSSIQAQGLGGPDGGTENCAGGSCTFTHWVLGKPTSGCSACCPTGKSPSCTAHGCECIVD